MYVDCATVQQVKDHFKIDRTTLQRALDERGIRRAHHPALDDEGERRVVDPYQPGLHQGCHQGDGRRRRDGA